LSHVNRLFLVITFDISFHSACIENGSITQQNVIYDAGCPFIYEDPSSKPCDVCDGEFVTTDRALSNDCKTAILKHCKYFYKEDADACSDFPELIIGGSCDYDKLPPSAITALELGITNGRNGKGAIFTFASGNSFTEGDDVNFSGWTNSRYTISVGAVGKDGLHADYSSPGAALLVSAPAGGNKDIGHLMTAGLGVETCVDSGQGTSFACPVVSGVIALMLEANSELSWRDVQGILAISSKNVDADTEDDTQTTNGAGIWHSNWYGFGIINAKAAVEASLEWDLYTDELQAIGMSEDENVVLADEDGNEFVSEIKLGPGADKYPEDFIVESTVVLIDLSHYNRGDLEIELVSPFQTTSILHPGKRPENSQLNEDERWKLMTVKNWGEDPTGTWKLKIRDLVDREDTADKNVFQGWQLVVYGRSGSGESGFGVGDTTPLVNPTKSEFCLDPDALNPGCILNANGDNVCPAQSQVMQLEKTLTIDATIVCPNDVLISENIGYDKASQRGLCSCDAGLFDSNCDVIEEDLECECFVCPTGSKIGVAYSCNKDVMDGCKTFNCDATCNGAFEFPLLDALPATNEPTRKPTTNPTNEPTRKPTTNPSNEPTKMASASPTREPTVSPTREPTRSPTREPTSFPTKTENLSCEDATPITSSTSPVEGTIRSSPVVAIEGPCLSGLETIGGWYQVIGNGNVFTLAACSLEVSKSVGISVFAGACSRSECIENQSKQITACENGNGHATSFVTEPGIVYNVLVSGIPVGAPLPRSTESFEISISARRRLESKLETDFRLELTEDESPPNSICGSAFPATFNKPVTGSTVGLLTTSKTCQGIEKPGAWYTVEGGTPNEEGAIVYEANTCNQESNFYNTMSVFQGDKCGSHECVENVDVLPCPSGWFGQQVFWSTSLKENYQIFVHSSDVIEAETYNAGSFSMDIKFHDRLVNDQCAAALEVELNRVGGATQGFTSGAKPDMESIENSSCGTGGAGAWYSVMGTGTVFQASTCSGGTNHKTAIQVYSGECGKLACIDSGAGNKALCGGDGTGSVVNFKTQKDIEYFVLVTGRREGITGKFGLDVIETIPPENNECSAAVALNKEDPSASGSSLQATIDFPHGYDCAVPLDTPGVWYEVEGTGKGVEVSTCQNNEFDSAISVFKGSCNKLDCVAGASAINSKCTVGQGAATSFFGEKNTQYHVYVHGKSTSSNSVGDFTISYSEFDVLEQNEFCPSAREVPTDGSRVQGSTEDATHASIPSSICGVEITNPGLWYTFKGSGQPFEISACSEDIGDFDVAVSVFAGGPGGCDSLTCVTGTTFVENVCSTAQELRFLKGKSSAPFRFMTETRQDYYIFVHGAEGVGDFDLFVRDEKISGFGTAAPTETPKQHGKDLYRWIPFNTTTLAIATDYLDLEIVNPPSGNVIIQGYWVNYIPPLDFTGDDVMTLDGCNDEDCYRFDVTISVMGEKTNRQNAGADDGWNKMWLLLLILLLLIPCICLPFCLFYKNKNKDKGDNYSHDDRSDEFGDDDADEKGLLPVQGRSKRGGNDSSGGEDWESSVDDDESYDSGDKEFSASSSGEEDASTSDGDNSEEQSNDGFNKGFSAKSSDGFNDEYSAKRSPS
jgi:subtilisin-like proprotein convertase family protein